MKIKKGDRVVVLSGKDRGKEGVVMIALPTRGKVVVEGVNTASKHQRPTKVAQQGGIVHKDMPIDASNVAIVSPKDGKATRVGFKIKDDGTTVRVCKRTGAEL